VQVTRCEEVEISERIHVSAGISTSGAAHFRASTGNLILELFVRSADENYATARREWFD